MQTTDIKSNSEDADKTVDSETPPTLPIDECATNASTEVLLDVSISDRIAGLSISGDESSVKEANYKDKAYMSINDDDNDEISNKASTIPNSHKAHKTEKSDELCRSILAGEVSDNSERSVEEDEASDYVDNKVVSGDVSDEEMFIEDEDVEEEEEFHEVEEEKQKTSQESVSDIKAPEANIPQQNAENLTPASEPAANTQTFSSNSEISSAHQTTSQDQPVSEPKECVPETKATDGEKTESDLVPQPIIGKNETEPIDDKTSENTSNLEPTDGKVVNSKDTDWANLMQPSETGNADNSEKETVGDELPESTGQQKEDEKIEDIKQNVDVVDKEDGVKVDDAEKVEDTKKLDDAEKKELDLDEDVKNPQYIPKKGVFYEHDDRSHDINDKKQLPSSSKKDEETIEVKESSNSKKTGVQEKQIDNKRGGRRQRTETDRWNHDLFRDEKQKPKSKSELITAYGYDIRQERASRNYAENRSARSSNNNTTDRQQGSQENQRSRPIRDNRARQTQPLNRSRDRRSRRPNTRGRNDSAGTSVKPRDATNSRPLKPDTRDIKQDYVDGKQNFQNTPSQSTSTSSRRDYQEGARDRVARHDNRARRVNSKDRPASNPADDKLPPINTVMPPITTWSNKIEDMVKEEASQKESPSRLHKQHLVATTNNPVKARSNDYWPQTQQNKTNYHEKLARTVEDNRHQQQPQQQQMHYNSRRYQDRDDSHKSTQYINRNQYNERSNQHHNQEWRRTNNYSNYAKSNEYEPIKTQTFENSRLSQANMNRHRDAREIINERRLQQNQQNFQPKNQPSLAGSEQQKQQQQRHPSHPQHQQQHQAQSQHQYQHQHLQQFVQLQQQQQHLQQLQHHQTLNLHQHQQQGPQQLRQPQPSSQQPEPSPQQQSQQQSQAPPPSTQQLQNQRQQQQAASQQASQQHQTQHRQNIAATNISEGGVQESCRLTANNPPSSTDLINSRPIIKTDTYTGGTVGPHSQQGQPIQQHSQNHRSLGGTMSQQGPGSAASHLVSSHLSASNTQAQYYSPSSNSRDTPALAAAAAAAAAAQLAPAYHGYVPSGHSVMDANRYHMTQQQLSDHGYIASPGQANDVAGSSVLLSQGMYSDAASAGGTVASSAYLAQAGSTLSPSTNIPVSGTGPLPPLAPVSYLQHSQYAPPPYSNPYSQPQHNQAPPPSNHAYPYWTYI